MKKIIALILSAVMILVLTACGGDMAPEETTAAATLPPTTAATEPPAVQTEPPGTEITLQVGGSPWTDRSEAEDLIAQFHSANSDIRVTLAWQEGETRADVLMDQVQILTARDDLADLSALWDEPAAEGIYDSVRAACGGETLRVYPMTMRADCMAINKSFFEQADALQYLDAQTGIWTTEGFLKAVQAVSDWAEGGTAGIVYCGGSEGDFGTRALVTNLYGGSYLTEDGTGYAVNAPENRKALKALYEAKGIGFDPAMQGSEQNELFLNGELAISFCWDTLHTEKTTENGDEILCMAFPAESGQPRLSGSVWGLSIADGIDAEKTDAAEKLIHFLCENCNAGLDVRGSEESTDLGAYVVDFGTTAPGWEAARGAWWIMLQNVGAGIDPADVASEFLQTVQHMGE